MVAFILNYTGFAEHVIKCAKRRRKKSIRSQRRIARNGVITAKTPVQTTQKSPTGPILRNSYMAHDKLSSPMKQEIRAIYRLKLAKHVTDHKQSEGDGTHSGNQSPCRKPMTSSPIVLPNVQGFAESLQANANPVKRKLTYLSEKQSDTSPMTGAPNPPPCTPDNEGMNKLFALNMIVLTQSGVNFMFHRCMILRYEKPLELIFTISFYRVNDCLSVDS